MRGKIIPRIRLTSAKDLVEVEAELGNMKCIHGMVGYWVVHRTWSFFCCQHNPFPREFLVKIAIVMIKSKRSRRKSTKYQLSSGKGTRSLPATPHCLQCYTACIAVPPAMPCRLQHRTAYNASPPSTPTCLHCRTS